MVLRTISSGERCEHKRAAEGLTTLFKSIYLGLSEALALSTPLPYHRRRTGGRVVDGTALEMRRTCEGTVGSNPTLSATPYDNILIKQNISF